MVQPKAKEAKMSEEELDETLNLEDDSDDYDDYESEEEDEDSDSEEVEESAAPVSTIPVIPFNKKNPTKQQLVDKLLEFGYSKEVLEKVDYHKLRTVLKTTEKNVAMQKKQHEEFVKQLEEKKAFQKEEKKKIKEIPHQFMVQFRNKVSQNHYSEWGYFPSGIICEEGSNKHDRTVRENSFISLYEKGDALTVDTLDDLCVWLNNDIGMESYELLDCFGEDVYINNDVNKIRDIKNISPMTKSIPARYSPTIQIRLTEIDKGEIQTLWDFWKKNTGAGSSDPVSDVSEDVKESTEDVKDDKLSVADIAEKTI